MGAHEIEEYDLPSVKGKVPRGPVHVLDRERGSDLARRDANSRARRRAELRIDQDIGYDYGDNGDHAPDYGDRVPRL